MYENITVTFDEFIPGYEIIEYGKPISHTFVKRACMSNDPLNRFLDMFCDRQTQLTHEVINRAVRDIRNIIGPKGWNAAINFDIQYGQVSRWAGIQSVWVYVYAQPCVVRRK